MRWNPERTKKIVSENIRIVGYYANTREVAKMAGVTMMRVSQICKQIGFKLPDPKDMPYRHGFRATYNRGCRCGKCTKANTLFMASIKGKTPPSHGTPSGYANYGCRCRECKAAGSILNKLASQRRKERLRAT